LSFSITIDVVVQILYHKKRGDQPLCVYLERTLISPYISERNATELRDTIPAICSASISLYIRATTIAKSTMYFITILLAGVLNTTICGVSNLRIVKSRCLLDLLLDEI